MEQKVKKHYEKPEIEIVELSESPQLLSASPSDPTGKTSPKEYGQGMG